MTVFFPAVCLRFAAISLAFVEAQDWDSYRREQGLITSSMDRILEKSDFYGIFNVRLRWRRLLPSSRGHVLLALFDSWSNDWP